MIERISRGKNDGKSGRGMSMSRKMKLRRSFEWGESEDKNQGLKTSREVEVT